MDIGGGKTKLTKYQKTYKTVHILSVIVNFIILFSRFWWYFIIHFINEYPNRLFDGHENSRNDKPEDRDGRQRKDDQF